MYIFSNIPKVDYVVRLTHDTFALAKVDTVKTANGIETTQKKTWSRDTIYYAPIVDTIKGKDGKPVLDSATHQVKYNVKFAMMPKDFMVQDFNKSVPAQR
ncbi:MAG: hypothetical protein NVS1B13_25610 [Flavisolibacter sp.]